MFIITTCFQRRYKMFDDGLLTLFNIRDLINEFSYTYILPYHAVVIQKDEPNIIR